MKHIVFISSHAQNSSAFFPAPASAPIPDTREGFSSTQPPTLPKGRRWVTTVRTLTLGGRDGVATLRLSIFNCLLRTILHIQSSFPSPFIMDHAYLSCIVNAGTELEARYFIPPPLLTAVINAKACAAECRWQNKVNNACSLQKHLSAKSGFFRSRVTFVGLQTAHHPRCVAANPARSRHGTRPTQFHMQRASRSERRGDVGPVASRRHQREYF